MVPVRVHGITADPNTNQFLMLLVDDEGGRLLPIVIGQWEAQSIAWNMQGIKMQRPMTHDLFKTFLNSADIKMEKVVINNLKENTFYATIALKLNGHDIEIDSRPSDAIAIALRLQAPIFVMEDVFERASVKVDSELEVVEPDSEIDKLNSELKEAIEKEEYEKAAKLRDKIKEIENKNKSDN